MGNLIQKESRRDKQPFEKPRRAPELVAPTGFENFHNGPSRSRPLPISPTYKGFRRERLPSVTARAQAILCAPVQKWYTVCIGVLVSAWLETRAAAERPELGRLPAQGLVTNRRRRREREQSAKGHPGHRHGGVCDLLDRTGSGVGCKRRYFGHRPVYYDRIR